MSTQGNKVASGFLPLSHMVYVDGEVNVEKAKQLVVYHYTLSKGYKWKEWETQLDEQLSDKFYPYLMKSHLGQFGLFVAVNSESDTPPKIVNSDGVHVEPLRVDYTQEFNPIWIRLLMRKVRAFGVHCEGSHTLGRPLLKVDSWKGQSGAGISAIGLDCRTQMLKDKTATEVVLFHENIPLREVADINNLPARQSSLWVYRDNKVLMRWFPQHKKKPKGPIYREISKSKNNRTQRAFLDVSSKRGLEQSWPWILKPIQDEFIKEARLYGFELKPKVLHLKPLPLKTKYKTSAEKTSFTSLDLSKEVLVVDLRVSSTADSSDLVNYLQSLVDKKSLGAKLILQPSINEQNIQQQNFSSDQRLLVLLDQKPNIVGDRYPLTIALRTKVACQHINVNPNDLFLDSVESNFLAPAEDPESGKEYLMLQPGSLYFDYALSAISDNRDNEKALLRNLEIALKELELKSLLLNEKSKISASLPEQSSFLNEDLIVITDGYLFTVKDDRPVLVLFDPSDKDRVKLCDMALSRFDCSVASLLASLQSKWPYNYRPDVVMQGFGSPAEKLTRFAARLTFVLFKGETTTVMFQDPKYETPHMIPHGLELVRDILTKQEISYKLKEWLLPAKETLEQVVSELVEEEVLNPSLAKKLLVELDNLLGYWKETLKELIQAGHQDCLYKEIKKLMFKKWLENKNLSVDEGKKKKTADTKLISAWDDLLSRVLELPLKDIKGWLRNVPGVQRLWYDEEQHYFVVGSLASPKSKINRQPSIRQWHCLAGQFNPELITALVDVDWVRVNQLAGNPCVAALIRRWKECQKMPEQSLGHNLLSE
ncbi:hypothetical protein [Rheinheimera sp. NSM]|uniref:hypothetical protein n=1 Tax=Rheinheimera sp. NSM TaxID=3457884 RepID=UPI004037456E